MKRRTKGSKRVSADGFNDYFGNGKPRAGKVGRRKKRK